MILQSAENTVGNSPQQESLVNDTAMQILGTGIQSSLHLG